MKADLFVLVALACVASLFAYAFIGGLTVRLIDSMYGPQSSEQRSIAGVFWPVALPIAVVVWVVILGAKASQWRPRHKSTLPGARVVKP